MTVWVILGIAALLVLLGVAVLGWVPEKPFDRYEFEHLLHLFAKYHENGSELTICHLSSEKQIQFLRTDGEDDSCVLVIRVPLESWSKQCRVALERTVDAIEIDRLQGCEATENWVVEARIPVADVRREDSGAFPARVAHRVLDALGLGLSEKFSRTIEGTLSQRYKFEVRESDY